MQLLDTINWNDLSTVRRFFHANPEVSELETNTAKAVSQFLEQFTPTTILTGVGGTGVIAIFDSKVAGKTVLIRAELDALPIQEINTFDYRSQTDGVSHKCGHDGHLTILLGLAQKIANEPFQQGKVILLFQPAEENGAGAVGFLADKRFAPLAPDYVFALHNLPSYPLHQIVLKRGSFNTSVKSVVLRLNGKTAHAAEPEHGINPALAISEILIATNTLSNNDLDRSDFAVVTPIHLTMGEIAYGISAGYGEVHLTIRTWTEAELNKLSDNIVAIATTISTKYQLKLEVEWNSHFRANENHDEAINYVYNAASKLDLSIEERQYPFKWGEDFGLFTQQYKGAMFGLGSGLDCPALHNPDYDFPDELLPTGIQLFYSIISEILN